MKTTKIALLVLAIAVVLYILIPRLSWAEDGVDRSRAKGSPDANTCRMSRRSCRFDASSCY